MSFVVNDSCLESLSAVASQHEDWIIQQAIVLLERRIFKAGPCLIRPAAVRDYLRLKLVAEPNEIVAAVFLDNVHQVLAYEPLFKGTINSTSVYPRVVVQRVLELNAAAVVFAHQHPSGISEPSSADRVLPQQLHAALALIDVRVLDHIIVGQGAPFSFAAKQAAMRGGRDAHCLLGPHWLRRLTTALINFRGARHASSFFQVRTRLANLRRRRNGYH